jgi:putative membrane protein
MNNGGIDVNRGWTAALLAGTAALAACNSGDKGDNTLTANNLVVENVAGADANAAAAAVTLSAADQQFVTDSIKSDTAEISIAQLAQQKGTSQGVKDLATMLETDHSAHKQKLVDLATGAGATVPTEPTDSGKEQLAKLQGLSGADFDKTFAQMMVENHKKGIAKNEAQAKGTGPVAELSQATLPTLQKHLETAESLAK